MLDTRPFGSVVRFSNNFVAVFSDDDAKKFRYVWAHCWNENLPLWMWVMLNPSMATEEKDDPTVNRCVNFTKRLSGQGAGGLVVVNLFAYRATDPYEVDLHSHRHVGAGNDDWIRLILESGRISRIIAAWGNDGHFTARRKDVARLLRKEAEDRSIPLSRIGTSTNEGAPRHPSPRARRWLPDDSPLHPYRED